jgi:hypothetical protein
MFTIATPVCPICHNNYEFSVEPRVLYPCGHGLCKVCIDAYRDHDGEDIKCPTCRQPIEKDFKNYDLIEITNNVNTMDMSEWCKKLIGCVEPTLDTFIVHPKIESFAEVICSRISMDSAIKNMIATPLEFWSADEKKKFDTFVLAFISVLKSTDTSLKDALKWLKVLRVPNDHLVRKEMMMFYDSKAFLETLGGVWILTLFT